MALSIFDIKDEFKALKKMIADKKMKAEVITSAKKQLYEHLDLKYNDYNASITKIGREVQKKMDDTQQYIENMEEVQLLFKKKLELETKKVPNDVAQLLGQPLPFSAMHLNNLEQEIIELEKRQKSILENKVDIEALPIQMGRLQWLSKAIEDIKNLKQTLQKSTNKDRTFLRWYRFLQILSFVLSVYGAFQLVEVLKQYISIHEFWLNMFAGIVVLLFVDSITNAVKEWFYEKYLESGVDNFGVVIDDLKKVDNALSTYTF